MADWITSAENPYFAQVAVNRVWAELMGRGLVDPVDDLRATNPPSNPALLAALADEFRRRWLRPQEADPPDHDVVRLWAVVDAERAKRFGHAQLLAALSQRLRAEVLLDAVCDITGVREEFDGMPQGTRAMEIWTHRVESLFLDAFGRPDANQDPPYERTADTTVVQALAPDERARACTRR